MLGNCTKNKTGFVQMSSDHQQQRLWKKWEGYHESIASKDFQETFHVLLEDYIQTFHSPERQQKRKVTGQSVIGKNCEKIASRIEDYVVTLLYRANSNMYQILST
jgi:hypothetical protein